MSAEPSTSPTSESSNSDAWMEELLLAGVHAAVKPSISTDPIQSRLIAEPPIPSWIAEVPDDPPIELAEENNDDATNIDFEVANIEEPMGDLPAPPDNVELSHPLLEELQNRSADEQDRLVDDLFHGLNEPIPEAVDDIEPESSDSIVELVRDDVSPEAEDLEEAFDPVAAEIALALQQVEEAAVASELTENLKIGEQSTDLQDEIVEEKQESIEEIPVTRTAEEERSLADQNEALSQDAISSLLAKFDDEDDLPPTVSTPKEPAPKVSCPAGTPQPKINLAALKKKSGDEAPALAARLFGEGADAGRSAEGDRDYSKEEASGSDEKPKVRRLPIVLVGLDEATDSLRKLHPLIPTALGILGVFLLVNGVLTAVLASLGWI